MVDADLQDLLEADGDDETSDDGQVRSFPHPGGAIREDDADGCVDVEELVESLIGVPPDDAEWEVREALKKATGAVSETDVLGILLRVFRNSRDDAIKGYVAWDDVAAHCDRLTKLCDQGFVAALGVDPEPGHKDLPASIVATIYAECGRTLAVANRLAEARDRLQKALNVFAIVPVGQGNGMLGQDDASRGRQVAAATASMARVLRRLSAGQDEVDTEAREHYMKALQLYAVLPSGGDTLDFLTELCEFLGESSGDDISPTLPSLLADIAEDKFGEGSDGHLKVVREIAQVCSDLGRLDLAFPALVTTAKILRNRCGPRAGAMEVADVETAEEEAAAALESSLPDLLKAGELEAAADRWEIALCLRESAEGAESQTVMEMRNSLAALRQAAALNSPQDGLPDLDENAVARPEVIDDSDAARVETQSSDTKAAASSSTQEAMQSRSGGYTSLGGEVTGASLRPTWAAKPPAARASAEAADDGWDD